MRIAKLKQVQTKIRQDALATIPEELRNTELTLEESLHQKMARLQQIDINEEAFTYSLKKVHDKSFIT